MTFLQKFTLILLRLSLGWMMFWAGITKILDPSWSAAGYLTTAKTFPGFFAWLTQPDILPVVNLVNEWGLTLLGISLILGLGVRLSSILGSILMLLYYLPIVQFPYPNPHSYIVDEHVIYIVILLYFAAIRAGRTWGLENFFPRFRDWFG